MAYNNAPPDFALAIGNAMTLQMETGGRHRFQATLFGVAPGHSLLAYAQTGILNRVELTQDDLLVVRCLAGCQVYGFKGTILQIASQPYPYFHLSYPQHVECVEIRKSPRIAVAIGAIVRVEGEQIATRIMDLSATGAQCVAHTQIGKAGQSIELLFELSFSGGTRQLRCPGIIRNCTENSALAGTDVQWRYGVQFGQLQQEDILFLVGHLYEHFALHKRVI